MNKKSIQIQFVFCLFAIKVIDEFIREHKQFPEDGGKKISKHFSLKAQKIELNQFDCTTCKEQGIRCRSCREDAVYWITWIVGFEENWEEKRNLQRKAIWDGDQKSRFNFPSWRFPRRLSSICLWRQTVHHQQLKVMDNKKSVKWKSVSNERESYHFDVSRNKAWWLWST